MGSDIAGVVTGDVFTGDEGTSLTAGSVLDPLDLFGVRAGEDIEEEGAAARARVQDLMRSAESMRKNVLAQIKERDLEASRAAANMQRESLLRRGRSSTIL